MSIRRTFRLRDRDLTVTLQHRPGKPSMGVLLETDDNRCWSGICPATPKLIQVVQGIHELERQGPMVQYRARDLQAIRNWIVKVAHRTGACPAT